EMAASDLKASTDGADILIIVTGGNFQEKVAQSLAPLLQDGQIILLVQGNTCGSLIVRRALDKAGCKAIVASGERANYPMWARRRPPARIAPIGTKGGVQIATSPGNRIDAVFPGLAPLFPTAVSAKNVVYTGFVNANAMLHVANCVGNA